MTDAIGNNDIETIKNIIKTISDVNDNHYFFLHTACYQDKKEIVELLLNHGAKCDIEDNHGEIPLLCACGCKGDYRIVEMLLKRGSIDVINKQNEWTPLHRACYHRKKKIIEVLLRYGASLTIETDMGETPSDVARVYGQYDIILMINKEEERRRNVGNVGCHLLRASRAICGFDYIPPEIVRVVLSFFDEERVLTEKQVNVFDFGFDFTSLSNNIVSDKQQFISQMKLEF